MCFTPSSLLLSLRPPVPHPIFTVLVLSVSVHLTVCGTHMMGAVILPSPPPYPELVHFPIARDLSPVSPSSFSLLDFASLK